MAESNSGCADIAREHASTLGYVDLIIVDCSQKFSIGLFFMRDVMLPTDTVEEGGGVT